MFEEDRSMSQFNRDEMEEYMAPGALDGFLGMLGDTQDTEEGETVINEAGEKVTTFNIPQILLQTLPIAPVEKDTVITALTPANPNTSQKPATISIPPSDEPQAGTSGVNVATLNAHSEVQSEVGTTAPEQPKKGLNTKNGRKKTTIQPPQPHPQPTKTQNMEDNGKTRLQILSEIAEVVKCSGNSEMEVWGQYIGLKACRLAPGPERDEALIDVERRLNKAIYDQGDKEE